MSFEKIVQVGVEKHPRRTDKFIAYGTAGFRTKADLLDHVMYRMGALAVIRSILKKATIGVMITASHNPEEDNGVKLVDPAGEMLEASWEGLATKLANAEDEKLGEIIAAIVKDNGGGDKIDLSSAKVVIGRDTRKSSEALSKAVLDGISAAGGVAKDYGVVTTPQLHYFVVCLNTNGAYGEPTEKGYFRKLSEAFKKLRGDEVSKGNYEPVIKFDGANGVGAQKMEELSEYLGSSLSVEVINSGKEGEGILNLGCGADFVKVNQKASAGMENYIDVRCVSVDGDADRVVYFYHDSKNVFHLLDGDKIATLVASYLVELVKESGLTLNLGIVQTAYANGSSTDYITKTVNVPVACVSTGVKHLHHKAKEFDIGVYFEANGHGTVIFSPETEKKIKKDCKLYHFLNVINQSVGDAISDMLMVETILHAKGWSIHDWNQSYEDLPNRLMKVRVADRTVITTTDAERKCVKPEGLQPKIDEVVKTIPRGRSFVRPSGTEDVVRVYAEANTQENADKLAKEVALLVQTMAGGVE